MADIEKWWMKGDWFDSCSCDIPCPCEFAQRPTDNRCEGFVAYHIREGAYGDVRLDGLSVLVPGVYSGNLWAGECLMTITMLVDEAATQEQRAAIDIIFSGKGGGFMANIASTIGEVIAVEYVPITFEIAPDLSWWKAEALGRAKAFVKALRGPTTRPGSLVQTTNPPGSEVGPDAIATWGKSVTSKVSTQGFNWNYEGQSSKHMPFDLTGPDPVELWFEEA